MKLFLRSPVIAAVILALGLMASARILSDKRVHVQLEKPEIGHALHLNLSHSGHILPTRQSAEPYGD